MCVQALGAFNGPLGGSRTREIGLSVQQLRGSPFWNRTPVFRDELSIISSDIGGAPLPKHASELLLKTLLEPHPRSGGKLTLIPSNTSPKPECGPKRDHRGRRLGTVCLDEILPKVPPSFPPRAWRDEQLPEGVRYLACYKCHAVDGVLQSVL